MARTGNLTIVFTDMVDFTERTSRQSRAQNRTMLREHDRLLLPQVAAFGGRRIKSIGDAMLCTFDSPTDALRCAMALHDALAEFNAGRADLEQIHIRIAVNVGEVRVESSDIYGEPVNVAARVQSLTPPNEIYFTEAVYLAMNKAEVPSEPVGQHRLKGIPEPVRLFRVPPRHINRLVAGDEPLRPVPGELPFGGMHKLERTGSMAAVSRMLQESPILRLPDAAERRRLYGLLALLALAVFAGVYPWAPRPSVPLPQPPRPIAAAPAPAAPDPVAAQAQAAQALVEKGHAAFAADERREAAQLYGEALALDPRLARDPRLAANLVGALSWGADAAMPVIREHGSPEIAEELARRAREPGALGRARAAALLRELGEGARLDEAALAIADLGDAADCRAKVAVIQRMRQIGDPRALPALRAARGAGLSDWWRNRCLRPEADAAIQELERKAG